MWLDWQAHQLDIPCWWTELRAIPGMEDPQKLAPGRSGPPCQFLKSEAGSSQSKIILHPLPLSASLRMCSSQMNYLIRTCTTEAFSPSCPICPKIAVLGRETQSTREPRFLPLGEK